MVNKEARQRFMRACYIGAPVPDDVSVRRQAALFRERGVK
jgi:hypothetical protein